MPVEPKPWDYRPFAVACAMCGTQHTVRASDRELPRCPHCEAEMVATDAKPEDKR